MIYRSHDPRETQPQEHIDGVATIDISYGTICCLLPDGGLFTGKRVRHAGAQGNQRNSSDEIGKIDQAPEYAGKVTNDSGQKADHGQWYAEGQPTSEVWRRGNKGKYYLEINK